MSKTFKRVDVEIGETFDKDDELLIEVRGRAEYLNPKEVEALIIHLTSTLNSYKNPESVVWEN